MAETNKMMGQLICFEGIDGAGKSVVAKRLEAALHAFGIDAICVSRTSHPKDGLAAERLSVIADLLWNYPSGTRIQALGDRHLILLMAAWYHLFDEWIIRPAICAGRVVIVNQWIYKYIARFRVKGAFWAESYFDGLSRPDYIVFLKVGAKIAAARKTNYKFTESEGEETGQEAAFVRFQSKVAEELYALQNESWHIVDAAPDLNTVLDDVLKIVLNRPQQASKPEIIEKMLSVNMLDFPFSCCSTV